ncbi:MAG: helix-turn-helix transcriptional regulator [Kiloniellales bacterium]
MVLQTLESREWHETLARLMEHLGQGDLPDVLVETVEAVSASDGIVVFAYRKDRRPEILCDNITESERRHIVENYIGKVYLLGPVYRACLNGLASGVYLLRDLAPGGAWFYNSEYFKTYYRGTNLIDEAYIVVRLDPDNVILISVGRDRPGPRFGRRDRARLGAIEPVIRQAVLQQWGDLGVSEQAEDSAGGLSHEQLEGALAHFGCSFLTERECQVARMMLQGLSGKAVALKLAISPETAKIHRKRIYRKLDITSQAELFSLFIGALSCIDGRSAQDPLEIYLAPAAGRSA